jgi:DNA-binding MarR family transcriptional regulator
VSTAEQAWQQMRRLVLELHDKRGEVTEALGMSFIRAKALRQLMPAPMTMRELATALAIDAPYTTLVVDDLEERGFVLRSVHPVDRRVKVVSLTPSGADAARTASEILNEPPDALRALDEADLQALGRILERITDWPR